MQEQRKNVTVEPSDAGENNCFQCCTQCDAVKSEIKRIVNESLSEESIKSRRQFILYQLEHHLDELLKNSISYDLQSEHLAPFRAFIVDLVRKKIKVEISVRE